MIHVRLRFRILFLIVSMAVVAILAALMVITYTTRFNRVFEQVMENNLVAFETAEKMQLSLANQKGFLTYYFTDNDPRWLKELGEHRQLFNTYMEKAFELSSDSGDRDRLAEIGQKYADYISYKDQVIDSYRKADQPQISSLHQRHRHLFFDLLELGEQYKSRQWEKIIHARDQTRVYGSGMKFMSILASFLVVFVAVWLSVILTRQILDPIDRFASGTVGSPTDSDRPMPKDSLKSIFTHARSELEKSRENLEQAEKMAMVGRLAAGMAHTIRTPFTSVKMRLFSLDRSLELSDDQQEDFQVISQEIHRIDNILQNFLEFSRAPKLKIDRISLTKVVEATLLLLKHRLDACDIEVRHHPRKDLPLLNGDPEQLKEALLNIIINGCEAIRNIGVIDIREDMIVSSQGRTYATLSIRDSGPGIPEGSKAKILQPFFTTKDDGTGLGLSITRRIVEQHHGILTFESGPDTGTTFTIQLPVEGDYNEKSTDH